MQNINKLFIGLMLITCYTWSFGQQCPKPTQVLKADYKDGWGENSQSKTGTLRPGDTYEMNFIAQGGMKYRITVLSGVESYDPQNMEYQLVGTEVNKVEENGRKIYKRQEVVFFDSEKSEEGEKLVFSTPSTRKLTLKMKLNGVEDSKLVQCVIVFVETKRAPQVGFN